MEGNYQTGKDPPPRLKWLNNTWDSSSNLTQLFSQQKQTHKRKRGINKQTKTKMKNKYTNKNEPANETNKQTNKQKRTNEQTKRYCTCK